MNDKEPTVSNCLVALALSWFCAGVVLTIAVYRLADFIVESVGP